MHKTTTRFWQCLESLPCTVQKLSKRNFELLKRYPLHPSLHFKKVGKFWSVRKEHRVTPWLVIKLLTREGNFATLSAMTRPWRIEFEGAYYHILSRLAQKERMDKELQIKDNQKPTFEESQVHHKEEAE